MSKPDLDIDPLNPGADWFNAVFEEAGIDGVVSRVAGTSIGTGQIGENVRFVFEYERRGDGAPDTLVGKFPSDNEASLATAKLLGHYRREVMFYRTFDVAREIAPQAIYTDHDPETNRFCLIMQDMAPARQGDQLSGCTREQGEWAIDAAATLHAAHWNDAALDEFDWLQGSAAAPEEPVTPQMMASFWGGFKDRYGEQIADDVVEVGEAYAAFMGKGEDPYTGPMTLTHGDYRLDNMLFGEAGAPKALTIVDWQTPGKRGPMIDVAYFIGAGFTQADRPQHEAGLLERYHKRLETLGVSGYLMADVLRDYGWYAFYGMSVAIGAAMLVKQTERGDQMFLTMLRRHAAQVRANGGLDLIS